MPFFWSQHYDIPINYVGHAEKWDELAIDGDIAGKDCLVRFKRGGRTLAVASIFRDVASLQAEVAMERDMAALAVPRARSRANEISEERGWPTRRAPTARSNGKRRLRSREWFDAPGDPTMAALYLERYMNFGLTLAELHSGRPIIGIAQTGSDLSPCNRHHIDLAERVRDGIRDAGGIPIEFPVHPIQETGKRPTAALDRNLAYLSLVEMPLRLLLRRRGADHRLRQDHAGHDHGRGHGQHSGHRAVGRADARRRISPAAWRVRAPSSGTPARNWRRGASTCRSSSKWWPRARPASATATPWARRCR